MVQYHPNIPIMLVGTNIERRNNPDILAYLKQEGLFPVTFIKVFFFVYVCMTKAELDIS